MSKHRRRLAALKGWRKRKHGGGRRKHRRESATSRALRMSKSGHAWSRNRRGPQAPRRRRQRARATGMEWDPIGNAPRRRRRHRARARRYGEAPRRRRHRARAVYERGYGGGPVRGRKWHERRNRKGRFQHAAAPRRRRRHHHARSPFARLNPVGWVDTAITFVVGSLGYVAASAVDRYFSTSPILTIGGAANDAPLPGRVWNANAVAAPMTLKRFGIAAAVIVVPLAVSGAPMFSGMKTSLRVFSAGAAIRTIGMAFDGLLARFLGNGPTGQKMYQAEIAGHNFQLNSTATMPNALPAIPSVLAWSATGAALPGAVPAATRTAGTGGGILSIFGLGAVRRLGTGAVRGCCEAGSKGFGCGCASKRQPAPTVDALKNGTAGAAGLPPANGPVVTTPALEVNAQGLNRWGLKPAAERPSEREEDAA